MPSGSAISLWASGRPMGICGVCSHTDSPVIGGVTDRMFNGSVSCPMSGVMALEITESGGAWSDEVDGFGIRGIAGRRLPMGPWRVKWDLFLSSAFIAWPHCIHWASVGYSLK